MLHLFRFDVQLSSVYLHLWKQAFLVSFQLFLCAFLDVYKLLCGENSFYYCLESVSSILLQDTIFLCRTTLQVVCVFTKAILANSVVQNNRNKTLGIWGLMHQFGIFSFRQIVYNQTSSKSMLS